MKFVLYISADETETVFVNEESITEDLIKNMNKVWEIEVQDELEALDKYYEYRNR